MLTGIGGTCITGAEAITRVQRVADGTDTICTAVQVIRIGSFDAAPSQRFGASSEARTMAGEDREVKPKAKGRHGSGGRKQVPTASKPNAA
jgi:hypothetical protein